MFDELDLTALVRDPDNELRKAAVDFLVSDYVVCREQRIVVKRYRDDVVFSTVFVGVFLERLRDGPAIEIVKEPVGKPYIL